MTIEKIQLELVQHTANAQKLISAAQLRAALNFEARTVSEKERAQHEAEMSRESLEKASKFSNNFHRPCLLFRPSLTQEEDQWVAEYGELRAYGPTPDTAHQEFDRQWLGKDEL